MGISFFKFDHRGVVAFSVFFLFFFLFNTNVHRDTEILVVEVV